MKKSILITRMALTLLLAMVCSTGAWAEEVTEQQALETAQKFVSSHNTRKSTPKISLAGQVSGLYVFNVSSGGFVIVSNDDRTTSILGYGQSGSIDTGNVPENMRAWLQGYADEIAWLQTQDTQDTQKARRKAPRREPNGTESSDWKQGDTKTDIAPMITTKWNQDKPYNDRCPKDCATGCVATAMAQVMYYTERKAGNDTTYTTATIPNYTTRNGKHHLDSIAAGATIVWCDMIADYSSGSTAAQDTAIADLMFYCGCAVKMNYGPSSGAYTYDVDDALIDYFGYEESTTRYVNRNLFSYNNWIDLIYHELSQGRPVIYAGQSLGGGHEFVCDGYIYSDGDLFHINWGWGGVSDGYFVLSVLNPDDQGIGGSDSTDGYHYGQEAVIGIQKKGGTGTVLNVPVNEINLTVNSITLSHDTIALGESVDVMINVTNNSINEYDGEITLNGIKGGKVFVIPANTTQNCVITVTPTATKTYTIKAEHPISATNYTVSTRSASLRVRNQTPTDLNATDITSETATVSWTNVGDASKWNLRSRPASVTTQAFNSSTTDWILDGWTIDNSTDNPRAKTVVNNKKHWLITPKMAFGGSFSFYVWGDSGEKYSVLYSRNGHTFYYLEKDVAATDTAKKYTMDLSDYTGEGWMAIIHTGSTEGSYLYVDDATIVEPAGDWTMVSNLTTNSYSLTGLTATPRYEVQVQAVNNDGGNWSIPFVLSTSKNSFELPNNDSEATTKNVELLKRWNGITANVTLLGRTLYKDGDWNTLCLPFDVTIAGSPLDGADVRALDTADLDGSALTLNFTAAGSISKIVAGTPYIIKWNKDDSYVNDSTHNLIDPQFNGVVINRTYHDFNSNGVQFLGCYSSRTFTEDNTSILLLGTNNSLYWPKSGATIGACRAFFEIADGTGVRAFKLNFVDGEETAIQELDNWTISPFDNSNANGQMVRYYDLSGRIIGNGQSINQKLPKGIYIRNGKKVVVK